MRPAPFRARTRTSTRTARLGGAAARGALLAFGAWIAAFHLWLLWRRFETGAWTVGAAARWLAAAALLGVAAGVFRRREESRPGRLALLVLAVLLLHAGLGAPLVPPETSLLALAPAAAAAIAALVAVALAALSTARARAAARARSIAARAGCTAPRRRPLAPRPPPALAASFAVAA